MTATNGLVDELIDQLSVKTVFTIPIFGGIKIAESVVVMWIIMAVVIVASIFLTRNLSVENPGKRQLFWKCVSENSMDFSKGCSERKERLYSLSDERRSVYRYCKCNWLFGFKPTQRT